MIVYADVLVIVNLAVNYFLLLATAKILKITPKVLRLVLSAFVSAFSSLYIFLPQIAVFFEILFKIAICFISILIAFRFENAKTFFKRGGTFFLVTCAFGGIMTVIFKTLKPKGMAVYNSVVYFNISPLLLVGLTVTFYFVFLFGRYIFANISKTAKRVDGKVMANGKEVKFCGMVDTGNSVTDPFARSEIIIIEKKRATVLFGEIDININEELKHRFRPVPITTISGTEILDGFRCDSAIIYDGKKEIKLEKPIIAVANQNFSDGYNAILNPQIFN